MGAYDVPDPNKVIRFDDLATFVAHYHGIAKGKATRIAFYVGYAKFLEKHPEWQGRITYTHLAKACEWGVKNRRGRVTGISFLLYFLDEMVSSGALPELEAQTEKEDLEDQFYSILAIEDDPKWRSYLISTQGKLREQAITEWKQEHSG